MTDLPPLPPCVAVCDPHDNELFHANFLTKESEAKMLPLYTADQLREYAKKAVEAEREACAQLCDDLIGTRAMARQCADAIRASR